MVVNTTTQNSTPRTAGLDPSKERTGFTGYDPPPNYPATDSTGYPAPGCPPPSYPATGCTGGYPSTGYPDAPPPYPS